MNALAGAGSAVKSDALVEEPENENEDINPEIKDSDESPKSVAGEIETHIKDEL